MSSYGPDRIRNVALVGQQGSGKTTLAASVLGASGGERRADGGGRDGSVSGGAQHSCDGLTAEAPVVGWTEYRRIKVNLIDTPGDPSVRIDCLGAMKGADAAVVVVSAPRGVGSQTEQVYATAVEQGLVRAVLINKMDDEAADPEACLQQIRALLGVRPIPIQVPLGRGSSFRGYVDLFGQKAIVCATDGSGNRETEPIPAALVDDVDAAWGVLVEAVAETDESLLERYLENLELLPAQVKQGFWRALQQGRLLPVLYGAGAVGVGGTALLELAARAFPSPLERPALEGRDEDGPVEIEVDDDAGFLAQIIHTSADENGSSTSAFRIFRGDVPHDHVVVNTTRGGVEQLGELFAMRDLERTAVSRGIVGDIVWVSELAHSQTGDTLAAPGDETVLESI